MYVVMSTVLFLHAPNKCSIMALIVENTFTGIPTMAQLMFPGASNIPLFCFKNKVRRHQVSLAWSVILLVFKFTANCSDAVSE